jgi:hypothetical protein
VRVLIAAAPGVRHMCPPELVEGLQWEVQTDDEYAMGVQIAIVPPVVVVPDEAPSAEPPTVVLLARDTGREAHDGLPYWEARLPADWP